MPKSINDLLGQIGGFYTKYKRLESRRDELANEVVEIDSELISLVHHFRETLVEVIQGFQRDQEVIESLVHLAYWGFGQVIEVNWISSTLDLEPSEIIAIAGPSMHESKCSSCSCNVELMFENRSHKRRDSILDHFCPECYTARFKSKRGIKPFPHDLLFHP